MKYHLITAAIFIAALVFYGFGWSNSFSILLAIGIALESWVWIRSARARNSHRAS